MQGMIFEHRANLRKTRTRTYTTIKMYTVAMPLTIQTVYDNSTHQ